MYDWLFMFILACLKWRPLHYADHRPGEITNFAHVPEWFKVTSSTSRAISCKSIIAVEVKSKKFIKLRRMGNKTRIRVPCWDKLRAVFSLLVVKFAALKEMAATSFTSRLTPICETGPRGEGDSVFLCVLLNYSSSFPPPSKYTGL